MLVPPLLLFDMIGHNHQVSDVAVTGTLMHFCNGELLFLCIHAIPVHIFPLLNELTNTMFACKMHVRSSYIPV
jgi:hypothetical protein